VSLHEATHRLVTPGQAHFVADDLERVRDCDGDYSCCEGGEEGGVGVEVEGEELVLEVAVGVVVEERVGALTGNS